MVSTDSSNHYFQLAARFVNQTGQSLFLTGKAGTGKTTFLKYIRENSFKKTVVVAPTGVAAINAGGVTMHSFFQLPFGPFIPSPNGNWGAGNASSQLIKNIRFNNEKRELLKELELLIVDEVSMVRADMLDAMDTILRHFRDQQQLPFGGVQLLFIGDLFQLPPVVSNEEWDILGRYYKSPFFFDAQVLQEQPPLCIELKKIYRQSEKGFINLLNNIRHNNIDHEDLELLHQYYQPGFEPPESDHYITLTTHNRTADVINQQQLSKLDAPVYEFEAELSGDFNEKALPAEMKLQLKVGAQIMFIKNDNGEVRRFFNGRIAGISKIDGDKIYAQFPGEPDEMLIEKEVWKNIRYHYNRDSDRMEEEELGSFTQYPIRLAWAITIHKSQGLTFQKAIIDAGASFAAGQVYVALSRLTSLEGLVLYSRILPQSIRTDERIVAFSENQSQEHLLEMQLEKEQQVFIARLILKHFNWDQLRDVITEFYDGFDNRQVPDKYAAIQFTKKLHADTLAQHEIARKFSRQLEQVLADAATDNYQQLQQRVSAAVNYFAAPLEQAISSVKEHLKEYRAKLRVKKYLKEMGSILLLLERKQQQLKQSLLIASGLLNAVNSSELLNAIQQQKNEQTAAGSNPSAIVRKGETKLISLELFKAGQTIESIAQQRGLTVSTIHGHLTEFILTGEVDITELVTAEKSAEINRVLDTIGSASTAACKEQLGPDYSYNEIRAVLQWRRKVAKPQ